MLWRVQNWRLRAKAKDFFKLKCNFYANILGLFLAVRVAGSLNLKASPVSTQCIGFLLLGRMGKKILLFYLLYSLH